MRSKVDFNSALLLFNQLFFRTRNKFYFLKSKFNSAHNSMKIIIMPLDSQIEHLSVHLFFKTLVFYEFIFFFHSF